MMKLPAVEPRAALRRRQLLIAAGTLGVPVWALAQAAATTPRVEVWKSPTCGCCKDWVAHLQTNGFEVTTHDDGNTAARKRLGLPLKYGSCHTAQVGGYAIEGHVPAREIHRLLNEKPKAVGLSVPAMPRGSPGMDGPEYGNVKDPHDVLLVQANGTATVYQTYR